MTQLDVCMTGFSTSVFAIAPNNGTIAAAPKGTKEGYCFDKALRGFGQDLIGYDIASAIANRLDNWFATSAWAQQYIRSAIRSAGGRISVRAVGSKAAAFGEEAGYAGMALTAVGAYETYQQCMAQ